MIGPARLSALTALRAIAEGRLDLPAALEVSRRGLTDDRDRALCHDIVTGTVRWQRALDFRLAAASSRPLEKIDLQILLLLRLSAYQLLHLDRIPNAAVVDDAVNIARATGTASAAGFVNAVLRTLIRTRRTTVLPSRPTDPLDSPAALAYLGITQSHPAWLVERWLPRVGLAQADVWTQFNNTPSGQTLRVNTLRTSMADARRHLEAAEVETAPLAYAPLGLQVTRGNALVAAADGLVVVQDEASQLVSLALGARPGERVLDLCAAPGGKTTAIAADMANRGLLVACDVRPKRMRLLQDTVRRCGADIVRLVRVSGQGPLPFARRFDRVLVDAPCSGLGTLRRDPDVKWRRQPADLQALAEAQRRLLARAADVVAPGGRLVYATCSSEPEENDAVVEAFLTAHPEFARHPLAADASLPEAVRPLIGPDGALRTQPWVHGLEAFYAAALTRR